MGAALGKAKDERKKKKKNKEYIINVEVLACAFFFLYLFCTSEFPFCVISLWVKELPLAYPEAQFC